STHRAPYKRRRENTTRGGNATATRGPVAEATRSCCGAEICKNRELGWGVHCTAGNRHTNVARLCVRRGRARNRQELLSWASFTATSAGRRVALHCLSSATRD